MLNNNKRKVGIAKIMKLSTESIVSIISKMINVMILNIIV